MTLKQLESNLGYILPEADNKGEVRVLCLKFQMGINFLTIEMKYDSKRKKYGYFYNYLDTREVVCITPGLSLDKADLLRHLRRLPCFIVKEMSDG